MYEVKVEGLREFVAALEKVHDKYPDQLRENNLKVAEGISVRAKALAASYAGYHRTERRVARSTRAQGQGAAAIVRMGRGHPEWQGAEWGGRRYRQFQPWRGNQWRSWAGGPGYIIHPTIRDHAPELLEEYAKKLDELHRIAFPS